MPFEQMVMPVSATFRDVHVLNESEFIVAGGDDGSGVIMKTSDGGISWQVSKSDFDNQVNSLYFLNADTGFCADSDILIYKTTNGGSDWNPFYGTSWPLTVNRNLRDIWFTTDSTGFVCGGKNFGNGVLYKTGNGGDYWSFSEYAHEYRGICFKDKLNGVMCGYGSLLLTIDGGVNFTTIENGTAYYTGISLDHLGNYWMCDFNGGIYASYDSGLSWKKIRDASSWNPRSHQQNCIAISPSGRIASAGPNGFISWSDDNGNSWNDRESFGGNDILKMEWIDNTTIIAAGKNGVFKITL